MALLGKYKETKQIGEILISAGKLSNEQLIKALELQKVQHKKLGEVIVENGIITEYDFLEALSQQTGYEIVNLDKIVIPQNAITKISDVNVLKRDIAIPFKFDEFNVLHVAINDPLNSDCKDDIQLLSEYKIKFYLATKNSIQTSIDKYYGSVSQQFLVKQYSNEQKLEGRLEEDEDNDEEDTSESSIVKLVNHTIEQAARFRASDIHIEALEENVRVRYRIDGDLQEIASYPPNMMGPLVSRLKILGGMDISEKRKPQDGRITHFVDGIEYDIRVSILPTVYGEKTVMRLAEKKQLKKEKSTLGLYPDDLKKFDNIINNPHGIILVTGPTGSGKSTTLYTALSELNREKVNIITVEDPVEANINGINQVQVNNKADMTFANALRSILRQDPDIIMIGEIRDKETANIAVEASITGHLVVSTLHTNSAVSTITRLENMGIEPYLIADATVGIMAQRLAKRLCNNCAEEYEASKEEKEILNVDVDKPLKLRKPCGCTQCNRTGYKGRIGVYEILPITHQLRNMISDGATADELQKVALEEGLHTLRASAARLIIDGVTDISEMDRIARE